MNTGFYENLDTNFENAFLLCNSDFSHDELVEMLKTGNIPQKQIAALKYDYVRSYNDARVLIDNLTGCDGKIREAVAIRFANFVLSIPETIQYFSLLDPKIYADATIDINANVCRLIVDTMCYFKNNVNFINEYMSYLLKYTNGALDELDNFVFRDKKYVINKQIFKLYWCLEAIRKNYMFVDKNILSDILRRSCEQKEYTIREKIAQIVVNSNQFNEIKNILKQDSNYYVKVALNHH